MKMLMAVLLAVAVSPPTARADADPSAAIAQCSIDIYNIILRDPTDADAAPADAVIADVFLGKFRKPVRSIPLERQAAPRAAERRAEADAAVPAIRYVDRDTGGSRFSLTIEASPEADGPNAHLFVSIGTTEFGTYDAPAPLRCN